MKLTTLLKLVSFATVICFCCFVGAISIPACTKTPPIHDTVTVVKNDTTKVTDTLYATKPDPTVNLTKGLLLYLPFSGSLADSSGNNNPTSAINGAGLTVDMHGYANNAFGANGTNQVLLVTNNGSINFDTAYSISVDFMTTDLSVRHDLVSMVNWTTGLGPTFELGNSLPAAPQLLGFGANDISVTCNSFGGSNPNTVFDTASPAPSLGAWYNVIAIYHRGSAQLYVNGVLKSSKTGTGTLANLCPASNIVIGGWWVNDPVNLDGKLDNVRLYNRVLTPHEIATLAANYQVTSTAVQPGLRTH